MRRTERILGCLGNVCYQLAKVSKMVRNSELLSHPHVAIRPINSSQLGMICHHANSLSHGRDISLTHKHPRLVRNNHLWNSGMTS